MGQNLSQCKSAQHLTQLRTQFWLLAFKTLFFFNSLAPDSHIWAKKAPKIWGQTETCSHGQGCKDSDQR